MQEKELSVIISAFGYMLSIISGLIAITGASFAYIFTRHREDNSCEHNEIKESIEKCSDMILEHESRLTRIQTSHDERVSRCSK